MVFYRTLLLLGAITAGTIASGWAEAKVKDKDARQEITIRGEIVCLGESGSPDSSCEGPEQRFALRTEQGEIYPFLPSDPRAQMFTDRRVRKKQLQVTGLLKDGRVEIVHVHSVRDGELYDLYYRCEVCDITAYAPGPCWCCWQEFEFRETPAKSAHED